MPKQSWRLEPDNETFQIGQPNPAAISVPATAPGEHPTSGDTHRVDWSSDTIPYRGAEQHGVAFTADNTKYDPTMEATMFPTTEPKPSVDFDLDAKPIAVRVVEPFTIQERRMFSTNNIPMIQGSGPQLVIGFRIQRTKVHLFVKPQTGANAGRVWIGYDNNMSTMDSIPLDAGDVLDLETTEDVWAMIDPAAVNNSILCLVQTWTQEIQEAS